MEPVSRKTGSFVASLLVPALLFVALAPSASAYDGPTTFYLLSGETQFAGISGRNMSAQVPTTADSTRVPLSVENRTLWVAPPFEDIQRLRGGANASVWFQAQAQQPFPATAQREIEAMLQHVTADGVVTDLGTNRSLVSFAFHAICVPVGGSCVSLPTRGRFDFGEFTGLRMERGDTIVLALRDTGVELQPGVENQVPPPSVLVGGTNFPSVLNVTLDLIPPGRVQIEAVGGSSRTTRAGEAASFTVRVVNLQVEPDRANLALATTGSGWTAAADPPAIELASVGAGTATIRVTPPRGAQAGTSSTTTVLVQTINGGTAQLSLVTTVQSPIANPVDTDGDGFADDVEEANCSDPFRADSTPNTDDDGDRYSNALECREGTNPLSAASRPIGTPDVPGEEDGDGGNGGGNRGTGSSLGPLGRALSPYLPPSLRASADLLGLLLIGGILAIVVLLAFLASRRQPFRVRLFPARPRTSPGRAASITIQLTNRHNHSDVLDLTLAPLPPTWRAVLAAREVALEPRQTREVGLLVQPPADWSAPSQQFVGLAIAARSRPAKVANVEASVEVVAAGAAPAARPSLPEVEDAESPLGLAEAPEAAAPGPPAKYVVASVVHEPSRPVVGSPVTTTVTVRNQGGNEGATLVRLFLNDSLLDEKRVSCAPGEVATAQFQWTPVDARNAVRVVLAAP
ncbi:MAG TPA: CARDB domain-containing protein [Candidatus Thermoplasmatota archaeon]|nr:CARDB domain-containing protein [Candidatus Thermoplasmatota archaeon]